MSPHDKTLPIQKQPGSSHCHGKIGRISGGAFANLENIDEISFFNTEIGKIETNAFSNIKNISSLTFNSGRIQEFQGSSHCPTHEPNNRNKTQNILIITEKKRY
jgi:hypothetical protein